MIDGIFETLHSLQIFIIGIPLSGIILAFLFKFVLPSRRLCGELADAAEALENIGARMKGKVTDLDEISREAMTAETLSRVWREYAPTLRPQMEPDDAGRAGIVRWRATFRAESFFWERAVVDIPLNTRFHLRLSGLLLGLGILGTLLDLIWNLSNFQNPTTSVASQEGMRDFFHSMSHAFRMSALALSLALICAWAGRLLAASCYKRLENLRQAIDALFDAGAGEMSLERLVRASEASVAQTARLADALSGIPAQQREMMRLIKDDLDQLASKVDATGRGASEAVNGQLSRAIDLMEGRQDILKVRMDEFAGQIRDLVSESQMQAAHKLQETLSRFGEQVAGIIAELKVQARDAEVHQREHGERLASQAGEAVSRLSAEVEKIIAQSIEGWLGSFEA